MIALQRPAALILDRFIERQSHLPFSYAEHGQSLAGHPASYDVDHNWIELGTGPEVFEEAKAALQRWAMFPGSWAYIYPANAPIRAGVTVAMTARVLGLWWRNACRIVYVIDEPGRYGFAYGTLPGHVEAGEELFLVEYSEAERVFYRIRAFSRPRHWAARLGYAVARAHQRWFVRDSKAAMLRAVRSVATV